MFALPTLKFRYKRFTSAVRIGALAVQIDAVSRPCGVWDGTDRDKVIADVPGRRLTIETVFTGGAF